MSKDRPKKKFYANKNAKKKVGRKCVGNRFYLNSVSIKLNQISHTYIHLWIIALHSNLHKGVWK